MKNTSSLKRSGFKQKKTVPLKRSGFSTKNPANRILSGNKETLAKKPRKKKSTLSKLKKELWELCKQVTRKKYQNQDGTWRCFTCGKLIDVPAKAQTGHGIPSSVGGILLRYHLDNLRIQDYFCNINLGGNGGEYYKRLVLEIGQEKVDELYALKGQTTKADVLFFEQKIEEYKALLHIL